MPFTESQFFAAQLAWQQLVGPLGPADTAQVVDDLFIAALAQRAAGYGACLAPVYLTLQTSPPRVLGATNEANFFGLASSDAEIIAQVGWAWIAAYGQRADRPTLAHLKHGGGPFTADALGRVFAPTAKREADWAWIRRALGIDGPAFADVAAARAAVPA